MLKTGTNGTKSLTPKRSDLEALLKMGANQGLAESMRLIKNSLSAGKGLLDLSIAVGRLPKKITTFVSLQINFVSIFLCSLKGASTATKTANQLLIISSPSVAAALTVCQTLSQRVSRAIHLRTLVTQKNGFRNNPFIMQSAGRLS